MAYNEMMDNQSTLLVAFHSDQIEVLHKDIEVEVFGEDDNDEDNAENVKNQFFLELQAKADRLTCKTDRPSKILEGRDSIADRSSQKPIGQDEIQAEMPKFDPETDQLLPEAAPNVDSTCLDSFKDDIDSYDALMYTLIFGEGLTSEQHERLSIDDAVEDTWPEYLIKDPLEALSCLESCADAVDTESIFVDVLEVALYGKELTRELSAIVHELIRISEVHNSATKIIKLEHPSNGNMHHAELSSSETYVDHKMEQSEEINKKPSIEESRLVQQCEDQRLLIIVQTSVGLSNKRKLVLPCTKTDSETPLLERQSSTMKHPLGKELVWGRKKHKIFELTGEGNCGNYPSGNVVSKVECDPAVAGNYLGRSYGGFRDQFYIDPSSSTGGFWSRNDYHGPWYAD